MSGKLIALEGIDGSGTTTQLTLLGEHYGPHAIHTTREPSDGPIGRRLREILRGQIGPIDHTAMALLFAADRMDHVGRHMAPLLARRHVITDRYLLSSLAYQSLTVDLEFVRLINSRARPADLTLLLEVPIEVAEARRLARGGPAELFDYREVQRGVAESYRRLAGEVGAVVIDGNRPLEAVFADVLSHVETCIGPAGTAS